MGWIRDTDDAPDRRPTDVFKLVVGATAVVLTGVWAQSQSAIDLNFFEILNSSAGNVNGLARAAYALGSIWFVLAVAVLLLAMRHLRMAVQIAVAGAGTWGLLRLRTWGLAALTGAAGLLAFGAAQGGIAPAGAVGVNLASCALVGAVLLLAALAPFARPVRDFLRRT